MKENEQQLSRAFAEITVPSKLNAILIMTRAFGGAHSVLCGGKKRICYYEDYGLQPCIQASYELQAYEQATVISNERAKELLAKQQDSKACA